MSLRYLPSFFLFRLQRLRDQTKIGWRIDDRKGQFVVTISTRLIDVFECFVNDTAFGKVDRSRLRRELTNETKVYFDCFFCTSARKFVFPLDSKQLPKRRRPNEMP